MHLVWKDEKKELVWAAVVLDTENMSPMLLKTDVFLFTNVALFLVVTTAKMEI